MEFGSSLLPLPPALLEDTGVHPEVWRRVRYCPVGQVHASKRHVDPRRAAARDTVDKDGQRICRLCPVHTRPAVRRVHVPSRLGMATVGGDDVHALGGNGLGEVNCVCWTAFNIDWAVGVEPACGLWSHLHDVSVGVGDFASGLLQLRRQNECGA